MCVCVCVLLYRVASYDIRGLAVFDSAHAGGGNGERCLTDKTLVLSVVGLPSIVHKIHPNDDDSTYWGENLKNKGYQKAIQRLRNQDFHKSLSFLEEHSLGTKNFVKLSFEICKRSIAKNIHPIHSRKLRLTIWTQFTSECM